MDDVGEDCGGVLSKEKESVERTIGTKAISNEKAPKKRNSTIMF